MQCIALALICLACATHALRTAPPIASIKRNADDAKAKPGSSAAGPYWQAAAVVVPHPAKADRVYDLPPHAGGEDAYFVEESAGVLGVADGVGGWADSGVDPGVFSRQLMNFAAEEARAGVKDPRKILASAHAKTTAQGSSTALIVSLASTDAGSKKLVVANLGDSGFVHLREGNVLYKSKAQQHSFNFPFQLGAPGGGAGGNNASEAILIERTDISAGDVVVLGSDGLFDNMFAHQIASIVREGRRAAKNPHQLAERIAHEASLAASRNYGKSPFSVEAKKAGHRFQGGKLDDITVIVAIIGER